LGAGTRGGACANNALLAAAGAAAAGDWKRPGPVRRRALVPAARSIRFEVLVSARQDEMGRDEMEFEGC